MSGLAGSPSPWRAVVIAGAAAFLASAMTPASAAPSPPKAERARKSPPRQASAWPWLSLERIVAAPLRP